MNFPRWEGGDPTGWLSRVERYFHYHRTPEASMVGIAASTLKEMSYNGIIDAIGGNSRPKGHDASLMSSTKMLVQWANLPKEDAMWESYEDLNADQPSLYHKKTSKKIGDLLPRSLQGASHLWAKAVPAHRGDRSRAGATYGDAKRCRLRKGGGSRLLVGDKGIKVSF
ncbi:hypothetical protein BHM03_00009425 [Ensete ventricosum]|nr:hypothetical protein BHM03_00009425 [Ensete ventricosum]